ncbi:MAG: DUF4466 domain-containing protein [Chitinophagaceae bacterium]|nr:MAG: DUF4466 domain-containing protein [Chitinophagaceae bacterium]
MLSRLKIYNYSSLVMVLALIFSGCKKEDYALPIAPSGLQTDVIKRSLGPNMVGQPLEFAFAMAILPGKGKLASAQVEASIAGAAGTYLENNSYYTDNTGTDRPVNIGSASVTTGNVTTVTYNKDTSAATLRYYYVIPDAARSGTVSFKFTATASTGETMTFNQGPFTISKMEMVRNLTVSNNNVAYISIENMAVYNSANAAANAGKIDMVYLFRNITTSPFNHALVSPAADPVYLPGVTLPAGVNRSTRMKKVFNLQDYNLARTQFGIYIDDRDFLEIDLADSPNYAINLRAEAGVWVETADGKYRAYVYLNSVNAAGSAVISIKRYAL